jgi:hypothetical protein
MKCGWLYATSFGLVACGSDLPAVSIDDASTDTDASSSDAAADAAFDASVRHATSHRRLAPRSAFVRILGARLVETSVKRRSV